MFSCSRRSPTGQAPKAFPALLALAPERASTRTPVAALTATDSTRLFTYKVKTDRGSAPNPYFGVCTLAICKPRIRKHAKPGDLVVGFGCRSRADPGEEFRVVYAMQVEDVLPWRTYIDRCRTVLRGKIPDRSSPERYVGDCIYVLKDGAIAHEPLQCGSGHNAESFSRDVESGENVLVARRYWYFGGGDVERLVVSGQLRALSPFGMGHQVEKNKSLIGDFLKWFNDEVSRRALSPGVLGRPKHAIAAPRACTAPAVSRAVSQGSC